MKKTMAWATGFFLNTKKGLLFFYCLLAAVLLLRGLASFAYDRAQTEISPAIIDISGLDDEGNGFYTSTNGDPQLIFSGLDTGVRRVVLHCDFETPPGEVDLYYTRTSQAGFSPAQRVWGKPLESGGYEFLLPPGHISSLRVDPGNTGGTRFVLFGVTLNERLPLWAYFTISLRSVLAFALLPALAYCTILAIIDILSKVGKGKQ